MTRLVWISGDDGNVGGDGGDGFFCFGLVKGWGFGIGYDSADTIKRDDGLMISFSNVKDCKHAQPDCGARLKVIAEKNGNHCTVQG